MNKTAQAVIHSLSHEGRGIATIEGKTTFIEGALPGETVTFTYQKRKARWDEGVAIEIQVPSPQRIEAPCAHFKECGGCALQHMKAEAQIEFKQAVVLENLTHFGKITPQTVVPPMVGPVYGYRRKARLGVKYVVKKGKVLVGFKQKNPQYLADIHQCLILHPSVGLALPKIQALISELEAYAHIPQIEVAVSDAYSALIFRHLVPLSEADRARLKRFAEENQYWVYLQSDGLDSVTLLHPPQHEKLRYALPDFKVEIQYLPTDFTQVNFEVNQKMIARALEWLALEPSDRVLDLFCGLGNFTLPMARLAGTVIGVEAYEGTVERAHQNAIHNQLNNVKFYAANLQEPLKNPAWMSQSFDKILLDPPRTGALEVLPLISKSGAKKIVYVSCNPATLARDVGILVREYGYTLVSLGVLDMFPQTTHVESMALLEKEG